MIDIECAHVTGLSRAGTVRQEERRHRETKMLQRISVDVKSQQGGGNCVIWFLLIISFEISFWHKKRSYQNEDGQSQ